MAEHPRIEELRRRVQKDKASIAFAQLAEEYRRAGRFEEAIETCRTGLSHHPGYLSAHVTLGRALIEVGQWQQAQEELQRVLSAAPENLAALKGLAEIHHRQGDQPQALEYYRRALELAPHDPELEHLVNQMSRELESSAPAAVVEDGMSFEEAMGEFLALERAGTPVPVVAADPPAERDADPISVVADPLSQVLDPEPDSPFLAPDLDSAPALVPVVEPDPDSAFSASPLIQPDAPAAAPQPDSASPARAKMQVEALERWLDAILADRHKGHPPTGGQG